MHLATITQPSLRSPSLWSLFKPTTTNQRKTETMFVKMLNKFFWMKKPNHGHSPKRGHSIDHLSDHLKRDMGLIEADLNSKPRKNDIHSTKLLPTRLWL